MVKKISSLYINGEKYIQYQDENGLIHNENGQPASIDCKYNTIGYWIHGKAHRLMGPAYVFLNENEQKYSQWYYKGEQINCSSQEEFEKLIKLKMFWLGYDN